MNKERLAETFMEKARLVSAVVTEIDNPEQAFEYAVKICADKNPRAILAEDSSTLASDRIMAAPGLDSKSLAKLEKLCAAKELTLITEGLRDHLSGLDVGFTICEHGIAETGSLVLNSNSENLRLATMVSEVHVAVLSKSKILATAYDLEKTLAKEMSDTPSYLAFITGASRTADIERVLALGVHGPLELHILLLED